MFSAAVNNEFVKKREEDCVVGDFAEILVNKVSAFVTLGCMYGVIFPLVTVFLCRACINLSGNFLPVATKTLFSFNTFKVTLPLCELL